MHFPKSGPPIRMNEHDTTATAEAAWLLGLHARMVRASLEIRGYRLPWLEDEPETEPEDEDGA